MLRQSGRTALLSVTIHEGKNRQIRRMCAVCGLTVKRLRRVREHTLELGDLSPGKWRYLTGAEMEALNAFSRELLSSHIHTCVVQDIQSGKLEVVDELVTTIQRMMR